MSAPWITGPRAAPPRAVAGLLVAAFGLGLSITLLFLSMRAVMDVGGMCAEGGAYEIRQHCPEGAPLASIVGMVGLFAFGGLGIWAGSVLGGAWSSLPYLAWPALFGSLGYNFLEYAFSPAGGTSTPEWGWLVCGVVFEAMAFGPLIVLVAWGVLSASGGATASAERTGGTPTGSRANELGGPTIPPRTSPAEDVTHAEERGGLGRPAPDVVSGLERLAALHRVGSLTDEEFEDAKRTLLRNVEVER